MPAQDWIDTHLLATMRKGVKELITSSSVTSYPETRPGEFSIQRHPQREALLVVYGESDFTLNGHTKRLSAGDVVLINSWEPHSAYYRPKDKHLLHIWLHFHIKPLQAVFFYLKNTAESGTNRLQVLKRISISEETTDLVNARWDAMEQISKKLSPEEAHSFLHTTFQLVFEDILLQYASAGENEKLPDMQKRIEFVKSYIAHHNGRNCSLDILSKLSYCSKFHLVHLFRQYTGKTPGDYIDEARINYTKNAIQHGLRNKEIAENLGFSSPSAFGNWKKKFMK